MAVADFAKTLGLRHIGARRIGAEQFLTLGVIIGVDGHGDVGIVVSLGIALDAQIDAAEFQVEPRPSRQLADGPGGVFRVEQPDRLEGTSRPAIAAELQPEEAALERMNVSRY